MTDQELLGRFMELTNMRSEVSLLWASVPTSHKHLDKGQRRMASRVLQQIDARLEALDRVDCHSEDTIDKDLLA